MTAVLLALFAGCSAPPAPGAVDVAGGGDVGWVSEVARDPAAFGALTAASRDGWVALHANDLPRAVEAFGADPLGRGRSELALALLYEDLARVTAVASGRLLDAWTARAERGGGAVPPELPVVAALGAWCAGTDATGIAARAPGDEVAAALAAGRSPLDGKHPGPIGARLAVHAAARQAADPAELVAVAAEPMVQRQEQGFVRVFWDPCLVGSLAAIWRGRALADLGADPASAEGWRSPARLVGPDAGLGARLFAPWPTADDLRSELPTAADLGVVGAQARSLAPFGLPLPAPSADDPEQARQEVRLLDAALDAARRRIDDGSPEGAAVVGDLGLVRRFRQEWLVVRARTALAAGQPRRALTYLELARDHAARAVGPENAPSVFALIAEARLRLGHTREALDALHALSAAYPESLGAAELTGDLAVAQGLDRHGDSRED